MSVVVVHDHNLDPVPGYDFQLFIVKGQEQKLIGNFLGIQFDWAEDVLTLERGIVSGAGLSALLPGQKIKVKTDEALLVNPSSKVIDVLMNKTFSIKKILDVVAPEPSGRNAIICKLVLEVEELCR